MPLYKGLGIKDISAFLNNGHHNVFDYLPDQQEIRKVPKEWICNVLATVLKGMFTGWVKNRIEERNEAVKELTSGWILRWLRPSGPPPRQAVGIDSYSILLYTGFLFSVQGHRRQHAQG